MALTSYEAMTGRSLPTGVTSVVQDQPNTYVTGGETGYTPYVPKTTTRRIAKYDSSGKLLGYTIQTIDEDGKVLSESFEAASGAEVALAGRTLAKDTFKNTFALIFGAEEANKAYVSVLYDLMSGFYKSGSTIDEAMNLALRQARVDKTIPEFTNRFKGIFALEDRLKAGEAIEDHTIAEFIKTEQEMGEILRAADMPELATQEYLGDIIGLGKSVAEVGRIVSGAFKTIDNAPEAWKKELSAAFPTATRAGLAKALIGGTVGAAALEKQITTAGISAAAKIQGQTTTADQATEIANLGYGYQEALSGFGKISSILPTAQKLASMETGTSYEKAFTAQQAQNVVFGKSAAEQQLLEDLAKREEARFKGSAGIIGSKSLASQARGAGLI